MRWLLPALTSLAFLLVVDALALGALRPALPRVRPWLRFVGLALYWAVAPAIITGFAVVLRSGEAPLRPTLALFAALALAYLPKLVLVAVAAVATVPLTPWLLWRAIQAAGTPNRPELFAWRLRPVAITATACGSLALLWMVHALTLGRNSVATRSHVVEVPDLPAGLEGMRIVHLSDIHVSSLPGGTLADRLVRAVGDLEPDVVVYTGDFGPPQDAAALPEILGRLGAPLGRFAVLGNHDLIRPGLADDDAPPSPEDKEARTAAYRDYLTARGWRLLVNDAVLVERGGARLGVLGLAVDDRHHGFADADLPAALAASEGADFRILLAHSPTTWDRDVRGRQPIGVTFAGHTHAGQIALEIGSVRWNLAQGEYRRSHGVYIEGGQALHVSAGIGYVFLPFRLGCPSEVTLIELRRPERPVVQPPRAAASGPGPAGDPLG